MSRGRPKAGVDFRKMIVVVVGMMAWEGWEKADYNSLRDCGLLHTKRARGGRRG